MREKIVNILNKLYSTYSIGEHKGICTKPYIVVKFEGQIGSIENSNGFFQILSIFLFVPNSNILILDQMEKEIIKALIPLLEFTGDIGPEIIEDEKKAYSKRIQFRIPKGGI